MFSQKATAVKDQVEAGSQIDEIKEAGEDANKAKTSKLRRGAKTASKSSAVMSQAVPKRKKVANALEQKLPSMA